MADGFLHNIVDGTQGSLIHSIPPPSLTEYYVVQPLYHTSYMYVHIAIFKKGRSHKFHDLCKVLMPYKNSPTKA